MALGDITLFEEAKLAFFNGTHNLNAHAFKCALLENTITPSASDATPTLADYTQVGNAGNYVTGGLSVTPVLSEVGGVVTFDLTTNPAWPKDPANTTTCYWALIYNDTNVGKNAICFIDLGGPVDQTTIDLTVTWDGLGLFTVA